jgi:predicted dehydrogenase
VRIDAVASRQASTAAEFAMAHGVSRHQGSYEALLADCDIDAIYLPLPNSLHAAWAIRAAEAGKHVLCEKPLALNLAEAQAMFDAARRHGVLLLEAYPYWFQPATGAMRELIAGGAIGSVRSVQASGGFQILDSHGDVRLAPDLGGGALLDSGCYPLSLIRLVMGDAPQRVQAHANWTERGVDMSLVGTLLWDDGRRAQVSCAMDGANHRHATIVGSAGAIVTEYLNHTGEAGRTHPWGFQPNLLRVRRGIAGTVPFQDVAVAGTGSGFRFAAEMFAQLVATHDRQAIEQAARASLDIAAMLQALAQAARTGQVQPVPGP